MATNITVSNPNALQQPFAHLLESGDMSDLCLVLPHLTSAPRFRVHRLVLRCRSNFFEALCTQEFADEREPGVIELKDETLDETTLRQLLQWIYAGTMEVADVKQLITVIKKADYYQLPDCVEQCAMSLREALRARLSDNSIDIARLLEMVEDTIAYQRLAHVTVGTLCQNLHKMFGPDVSPIQLWRSMSLQALEALLTHEGTTIVATNDQLYYGLCFWFDGWMQSKDSVKKDIAAAVAEGATMQVPPQGIADTNDQAATDTDDEGNADEAKDAPQIPRLDRPPCPARFRPSKEQIPVFLSLLSHVDGNALSCEALLDYERRLRDIFRVDEERAEAEQLNAKDRNTIVFLILPFLYSLSCQRLHNNKRVATLQRCRPPRDLGPEHDSHLGGLSPFIPVGATWMLEFVRSTNQRTGATPTSANTPKQFCMEFAVLDSPAPDRDQFFANHFRGWRTTFDFSWDQNHRCRYYLFRSPWDIVLYQEFGEAIFVSQCLGSFEDTTDRFHAAVITNLEAVSPPLPCEIHFRWHMLTMGYKRPRENHEV